MSSREYISDILRELKENKELAAREELNQKFTPLSKRAWRKRERWRKEKLDKQYDKRHRQRIAKQKYYHKNKERLNRKRASYARKPQQVYLRSKRRALNKNQVWEFTFSEWWDLWSSCERVLDPRDGLTKTAWSMKGNNPQLHAQMWRTDTKAPWSVKNCKVYYRQEEVGVIRDYG